MNERIGLFKQLGLTFWGIISPNQFNRLRNQGFFKKLAFILFISIITSFLTYGLFLFRIDKNPDYNNLISKLPVFSLDNGVLTMPETFEYSDTTTFIYADTSFSSFSTADMSNFLAQNPNYTGVAFLSQTNLVLYNDYRTNEATWADISTFIGTTKVNNSNIGELIGNWISSFGFKAVGVGIIALIIDFYFYGLFYAIIGIIIKSIAHKKYSFRELFSISIFITGLGFLIMCIPIILNFKLLSIPTFAFGFIASFFPIIYLSLAISKKTEPKIEDDYVPFSYMHSYNDIPDPISTPSVNSTSSTVTTPATPEVPFNTDVPKESSTGFRLKQD